MTKEQIKLRFEQRRYSYYKAVLELIKIRFEEWEAEEYLNS